VEEAWRALRHMWLSMLAEGAVPVVIEVSDMTPSADRAFLFLGAYRVRGQNMAPQSARGYARAQAGEPPSVVRGAGGVPEETLGVITINLSIESLS
jgi:hypothetical protein